MDDARKGTSRQACDGYWLRGYLGHVYRSAAGEALGRVRRVGRPCVAYAWQTAHARSSAPDLATAKRCVELAVCSESVQPDLFLPPAGRPHSTRAPTWSSATADSTPAFHASEGGMR